jgi:hypothetical protein
MAWDPTQPPTGSSLVSAPVRANFAALDAALMAPLAAGPVRSLFVLSAGGVLVPAGWGVNTSSLILPGTDNAFDIGNASFRPRTVQAATSFLLGLAAAGFLKLDFETPDIVRLSSDKVIRITQPVTGLAGFTFNFGSVHSHYNWILGIEGYPDTGTGMLCFTDPVVLPTLPTAGMAFLFGADFDGTGTKGVKLIAADGSTLRFGKGIAYKVLSTPPGTPPSGEVVTYAKSDKKMYSKNDAGVETPLGGGGTTGEVRLPLEQATFPDSSVAGTPNLPARMMRQISTGQTTNTPRRARTFAKFAKAAAGANEESLTWGFQLPANYGSGGTIRLKWKSDTQTTGTVIWKGGCGITIDGTTADNALVYNAEDVASASTAPGTLGQVAEVSFALTMTNAAAGRDASFFITRKTGDTMTGDAILMSARFEYTPA